MKQLNYFFLVVFLFFFTACGDGVERVMPVANDDTADTSSDTGDTANTDTGDTENPDTGDTANTDTSDTENPDTGDTGNTDTGDTANTDTGDTEDSDTGDTVDTELPLTDEEKCVDAGGTWEAFADDDMEKCYKIVNCALPEGENAGYIVWRDAQSYTLYYDFENETWVGETYGSEYNDSDEPAICQYICASNARREDDKCKPVCSAEFNGSSSRIEVPNNDLLALGTSWTIEAWVKQDFNNLTTDDEVPIVRKGDGYYLSGFYKSTQGYNPLQQKTYYNMEGSFEYTYTSYGRERTDNFTVTAQYENTNTESPINDGWNHVALSYYIKEGKAHLLIYINGHQAKDETKTTDDYAPNTVSEALTIGYYLEKGMQIMPGGDSTIGDEEYFFKGKIDQLKISTNTYESEFTPQQLSVDDNTIAFWDFNNSFEDTSVNGLASTPTNVTFSTDCAF